MGANNAKTRRGTVQTLNADAARRASSRRRRARGDERARWKWNCGLDLGAGKRPCRLAIAADAERPRASGIVSVATTATGLRPRAPDDLCGSGIRGHRRLWASQLTAGSTDKPRILRAS